LVNGSRWTPREKEVVDSYEWAVPNGAIPIMIEFLEFARHNVVKTGKASNAGRLHTLMLLYILEDSGPVPPEYAAERLHTFYIVQTQFA
jgi:hypothetical protein